MDLSVIIVSWNAREYLLGCLRSLEKDLAGIDAEVIVVDNASTDGSSQAVRREFPNVILIQNADNLGFAKANNLGIRRSEGRYLALVNSDIRVLDGCMGRMLGFMDSNPSVGMLGPRVLNGDGSLQRSCRKFLTLGRTALVALGVHAVLPRITYCRHDRAGDVDILSGCFWVIRSKVLDEVGLLDEDFFMYGEDMDWCKRFARAGWAVRYYPEAEVIHYGGASSGNAPIRFYIEMHRANAQYWRKHHGRVATVIYSGIVALHNVVRIFRGGLVFVLFPSHRNAARHKIHRSIACVRWMLRRSAVIK